MRRVKNRQGEEQPSQSALIQTPNLIVEKRVGAMSVGSAFDRLGSDVEE